MMKSGYKIEIPIILFKGFLMLQTATYNCFRAELRRNNDSIKMNNIYKLMVTGKVGGRRPRGTDPTHWTYQILTTLDTTVHSGAAAVRSKWRGKIRDKLLLRESGHDP